MKSLAALLLIAAAFMVNAQTVTNLEVRVREEVVVTGVSTNIITTNFRLEASNKKEQLMVEGLAYYFAQYRQQGGTNDFGNWIKTDFRDRAKSYADAKARADYEALAAKINLLLLTNPDLLSNSDLTQLNAIAAKAP